MAKAPQEGVMSRAAGLRVPKPSLRASPDSGDDALFASRAFDNSGPFDNIR